MPRFSVVRENMARGTEGGMVKENRELWKLAMILVLYGVMVLKSMSKLVLYWNDERC